MNRDSLMTLGGLVLVVAVVVATFLYGQHQQQDQKNHDRQLQQQATATQPAKPTPAPATAPAASSAPQQPGVQKPASDSTGQNLQGSKESGAAAPGNVTAPAKPQPAPAPAPQTAKRTPATGANSSPATAVVPPAETPKTGGEVLYIAGVVITMGAGYRLRRSRAAVRAAQLRA